jgi:hypothetical protein
LIDDERFKTADPSTGEADRLAILELKLPALAPGAVMQTQADQGVVGDELLSALSFNTKHPNGVQFESGLTLVG